MGGETDLKKLLKNLNPVLSGEEFVFVVLKAVPASIQSFFAVVREDEGWTGIVTRIEAEAHGLEYEYTYRKITLTVHSSLEAVGLTAAVSQALAKQGIGSNVVAGYFHDHIFVPARKAASALLILQKLRLD